MDSTATLAYGLAAVLAGGLIYAAFIREHEADTMTLLGSANVQLELAKSFPETDSKGQPNPARSMMVEEARALIRQARAKEPGLHAGIELDAHLSWMDGKFQRAATLFQEASCSEDATPESHVIDRLNEARMWRAAGELDKALGILDQLGRFLGTQSESTQLQKLHVLMELGRTGDGLALAHRLARTSSSAVALTDVGHVFESQKETDAAERAYAAAAEIQPLTKYYLARLKIRSADFDTGLDLLKEAIAVDRNRTRILLNRDSQDWDAVRKDQRFIELTSSTDTAAPAGR